MSTIIFAFAIFCGWLVFDIVKHRKLTFEMVLSSMIVAVLAGLLWLILEWIF
ncbi:hypothetical protein [Halalkalibacter akibai]|uniref:Uncharacterized protein n=1 Tax=Halalkalibacter akibai (strain ATCC 43226 / DSM 21942 / CIP 109018 / JCM 9157 / 1139) TaxID=1236973 RepID=W4QXS7_HALA3|nr:hypothetical protein [Halalkalibacter akibai]GAE36722.1 hypothetical protein JCM9157_3936 [Halalkalibacter akibai JCM 9157]